MFFISNFITVCIFDFIEDQYAISIYGRGHSQATQTTMRVKITVNLYDQSSYRFRDIKGDIQLEIGIQINYKKAWLIKEHGILEINRLFKETYKKLLKYCKDLKMSNFFTTAIVDTTSDGRFHYIFLSFGAVYRVSIFAH